MPTPDAYAPDPYAPDWDDAVADDAGAAGAGADHAVVYESEPYFAFADGSLPQTRIEWAIAEAQFELSQVARAQAAAMSTAARVVREAIEHPELFVVDAAAPDAVEFAIRAVVAELAVRLSVAESVVRAWVHQVEVMRTRSPQVWDWFCDGGISVPNARVCAELVADLPQEVWAEFDAAAAHHRDLSAPRFASRMRRLAARLDAATLVERHARAATDRRVFFEPAADGMAWLMALLPIQDAHRAFTCVDRAAATIIADPEETRTLAQVRADVLTELLAGRLDGQPVDTLTGPATTPVPTATVSVAVTVPVMTLLGHSEEPGTLDGLHPIDAATARELAAHATSFTRILTHPISGVALTVDRGSYRVPADLKRWVRAIHPTCVFPGCGRRTRDCDLDHTDAYATGGTTSAGNLAPMCRHHHRVKHHTLWKVKQQHEPTGPPIVAWTTPMGSVLPSTAPF